jgi:hypothetical protein
VHSPEYPFTDVRRIAEQANRLRGALPKSEIIPHAMQKASPLLASRADDGARSPECEARNMVRSVKGWVA